MKLLVIGCGSIGKRHAENASNYAELGLYDQRYSMSQQFAKKINAQVFDNLIAAFEWQPDGVVVSTPHNSHVAIAKQAIAAGAHVLVEKPISNTLENVDSLIQYANERTKKLYVVCNMRFHSAILLLRENLPKIGRPLFARAYYGNYLPNMRPTGDYRLVYAAQRATGGGVILDAIHEVDYLRWFFGDVEAVLSEAAKLSNLDIDVEDYATIVLRHKNGMRSEIHLDYLQQCKRRGCEIIGEQGTLLWQSEGKNPEKCEVRMFAKQSNSWQTLYYSENEDLNKPYNKLMNHFVDALSEKETELARGEDGLATLRITLAALDSAAKGSVVHVS